MGVCARRAAVVQRLLDWATSGRLWSFKPMCTADGNALRIQRLPFGLGVHLYPHHWHESIWMAVIVSHMQLENVGLNELHRSHNSLTTTCQHNWLAAINVHIIFWLFWHHTAHTDNTECFDYPADAALCDWGENTEVNLKLNSTMEAIDIPVHFMLLISFE